MSHEFFISQDVLFHERVHHFTEIMGEENLSHEGRNFLLADFFINMQHSSALRKAQPMMKHMMTVIRM